MEAENQKRLYLVCIRGADGKTIAPPKLYDAWVEAEALHAAKSEFPTAAMFDATQMMRVGVELAGR